MLSKHPRMSPSSTHVALVLAGQHAGSIAQWRPPCCGQDESRRSFCPPSFRRRVPTPANAMPAWRGLSSSECPAASTSRWLSECGHAAAVAVDNRAAATCRWLCVWTPGFARLLPSTPDVSLALIVRHPFHGQGFAGKRAGQQPLQGFHLAPAAFLCCLDDTRLQPADAAFTLSPVNLVPRCRLAGGCTRGFIRVHLRFPPAKVLRVFSSRTTRWKSARLHGGDDVATPIRSITERPSLFPASSARHPVSVPCGRACLHSKAGCRVYHVEFQ